MMIGIHISKGDFSERWVDYCRERQIPYKPVCCYDVDIIGQLGDCDALMWHHNHVHPKDVVFAKQLLFSLAAAGKPVFPDFATNWHFDDKLGQKYLLEAAGVPSVESFAFYTRQEAVNWIHNTSFPKVFKLRSGAGSENVKLVRSENEAGKLAHRAFGTGFRQSDVPGDILEQIRKKKLGRAAYADILKAMAHLVVPYYVEKSKGRERGYLYFQEFIPGNRSDTRVVVIGSKAFALKRMVRHNDFRASGSGHIIYDQHEIDTNLVRLAFEINQKLKAQCLAFDFIHDQSGKPYLVEISYGFADKAYDACPGYWNDGLEWIEGNFNPYGWMVDDLIGRIKKSKGFIN
ncbi:MAG: hypothetical protein V1775_07425 [Bacteroidota bacterium]